MLDCSLLLYITFWNFNDDHLHFLTDWVLGPVPEDEEEEEEEVVESSGQEDRAAEKESKQRPEKHRATSGDEKSPGFKLSLIS